MCTLRGRKASVFLCHENEFRKLVYTPDVYIVELNIDGEVKREAILRYTVSSSNG